MNATEARGAIKQLMSMSQEQLNYVAAKALYDTVKARVEVETSPVHQAIRDNKINEEQWADQVTEIEQKHKYWTITDQLIDRENDLIAWAKSYIMAHHPDRYEHVKEAFERPVCLPHLRQKLVDICLKLIHLRAGDFYGHSYTLAHVMQDKPMCDYSKRLAKP